MKGPRLSRIRRIMRAAAQGSDESGLTLIELMIAAGLFLVISLVVLGVINNFGMAQNSILARAQGTSDGMVVFNQLTRDIRNAQIPTTGNVVIVPAITVNGGSVPTSEIELHTANPDGSAAVVCIIVQSASATTPTTCPNAPPTTAPSCSPSCTLTAYNVGTTGALTLRYRVFNLTTANIFTVTAQANGIVPQFVNVNAAFQPNPNEPAVTIQNSIELRNVAISS